jgi:hypothetical protein
MRDPLTKFANGSAAAQPMQERPAAESRCVVAIDRF